MQKYPRVDTVNTVSLHLGAGPSMLKIRETEARLQQTKHD